MDPGTASLMGVASNFPIKDSNKNKPSGSLFDQKDIAVGGIASECGIVEILTRNSSIYLSSYLGRNRTNPFTTNDIEFITSIVSSVPEAISLISYHNEHQLGYSELIEIIRKYPYVF